MINNANPQNSCIHTRTLNEKVSCDGNRDNSHLSAHGLNGSAEKTENQVVRVPTNPSCPTLKGTYYHGGLV
jgi:hypothetical protein